MHLPQGRSGFYAQFADAVLPRRLVDGERVHLPVSLVEREHELRAEALPLWVLGAELVQVRYDIRGARGDSRRSASIRASMAARRISSRYGWCASRIRRDGMSTNGVPRHNASAEDSVVEAACQ